MDTQVVNAGSTAPGALTAKPAGDNPGETGGEAALELTLGQQADMPALIRPDSRLVITAGLGMGGRLRLALTDLADTWRLRRLVATLAFLDIRLRYRGSLLGPFWLTLSTGLMVGALGFVYSHLFHTHLHTYLPFLSLSLVLWNFINALVTDGCLTYTSNEAMIRAARMPLSLHAARSVARNVLVLGHNILVIVVVFTIMNVWPGRVALLMLPAFALWMIDGLAISILLGGFCARFRDVPPIVASVMQIAFFVSPIIWSPEILAHRGIGIVLLNWNPFYALLEIVRAPLLNQVPTLATWGSALGYSAVLLLVTSVFFIRARSRISFWI